MVLHCAGCYGWHKKKKYYAVSKALCSSLFLLCALFAADFGVKGITPTLLLLLAALILCAFGDVFLGVANQKAKTPSRKPFIAGALSFLIAHLLFCLLFYTMLPLCWYDFILPFFMLALLYYLEQGKKVRLKQMRLLAFFYTLLVATMTSKALQVPLLLGYGTGMAFGAVLFMVSDVILLFLYFGVHRKRWMRTANLLSYYVGVYLMALSAAQIR